MRVVSAFSPVSGYNVRMSFHLSPELEQALTQTPWSLPRSMLPRLPRSSGFVPFRRSNGQVGVMLIDPEMDPPARVVSHDLAAMDHAYLMRQLADALAYRRALAEEKRLDLGPAAAYRLVNETGDGLPGLAIDIYAGFALLHLYSAHWHAWIPEITAFLLESGLVTGLYLTERKRGHGLQTGQFVAGRPSEEHRVIVLEHDLKYIIHLAEGPATGLYLDQRENRHQLSLLAAEGSLLNTFSYTCSFSVAAARHGASTLNIDLSKASLHRGRENIALNALAPEHHRFLADDVFSVLPRLQRRGERFQSILLDPPTFARVKKKTFSTERDYAELVALAAPLLADGGHLIAFANTHRMSEKDWTAQVYQGLGTRRDQFRAVQRPGQAPDFRFQKDDPSGHYLKGLILKAENIG